MGLEPTTFCIASILWFDYSSLGWMTSDVSVDTSCIDRAHSDPQIDFGYADGHEASFGAAQSRSRDLLPRS